MMSASSAMAEVIGKLHILFIILKGLMNAELEVDTGDLEAEAMVEDIRNYKNQMYNVLGVPVPEIDATEAEADLTDVIADTHQEKRVATDVVTLGISRETALK